MNIVQTWLVVGIPALLIVAALLVGRSQLRALLAYATLAATVVFFLLVPEDSISAGAIGLLGFVLAATGRGTEQDEVVPEHHETRRRFTVADPDAG